MKKILIGVLLLIIPVLVIVIVLVNKDKDYEIEYESNGLKITEKFYDALDMYYLSAKYESGTYEIAIESNYVGKNLVNNVEIVSDDEISCVFYKSEKLNTYPICRKDDASLLYSTLGLDVLDDFKLEDIAKTEKKYNKIKVQSLNDEHILIWNHFGYYSISKDGFDEIKLFDDEIYQDTYSFQVDNYILIPDYDQKHEFDKFYVINLNTNKVHAIKLEDKLSYNYYFMGSHDDLGYIFDRKNSKEYSIDPKDKEVSLISENGYGKIWSNKWEEISLVKLKNSEYRFQDDKIFDFHIENNKLFCKLYKGREDILITEKADDVIYTNSGQVFYTYNGKLYTASPYIKPHLILEYSEITFNKGLSLYIY